MVASKGKSRLTGDMGAHKVKGVRQAIAAAAALPHGRAASCRVRTIRTSAHLYLPAGKASMLAQRHLSDTCALHQSTKSGSVEPREARLCWALGGRTGA